MAEPNEESRFENRFLQALVKELTQQISLLFSDNDRIKAILERIEKEGFQVDSVVASLSPIPPDKPDREAGEGESYDSSLYKLNSFDYVFLHAIKVSPSSIEDI